MTGNSTIDLFVACAVVAAGGVLVLRKRLGLRWAVAVVALRVALPALYFGVVDTGTWRLLDDVTYAEEAAELRATGVGPLELVVDPASSELLFEAAGGRHVGYYAYNVLAQVLFGEHYWSAVLLNVFMTFVAARAVWRLLELLEVPRGYQHGATIFFLLHWDVVAWSSFLNLKDTLVMALSAWMFVGGLGFARRPSLRPALLFVFMAFLLTFLRWYVPLIALAVFGGWGVLHLSGWKRVLLIGGAVGGVLWQLPQSVQSEMIEPGGLVLGAVRFLFTPRPWGVSPSNVFLLAPSTIHWLLMPVALLGAVNLWRKSPLGRTLIFYLLAVVVFYALIPRLQGPRHRYQAVFALSLLQFGGLHAWVTHVLGRPSGHALRSGELVQSS